MTPPPRWLRIVFRLPRVVFDLRLSWMLGHRFLLLQHTGRRTGRRYATVLEVLRHDPSAGEHIVMAGFGRQSDWLRNLQAGGAGAVTVAGSTFPVRHRLLDPDEAVAAIAGYERHNRLIAPLLRRVLTSLSGMRYRSTEADRRVLVGRLPLVALCDRGAT